RARAGTTGARPTQASRWLREGRLLFAQSAISDRPMCESGLGRRLRLDDRCGAGLDQSVAMLARELECTGGVLARRLSVATCGERLGPPEVSARCPDPDAVGLMKLARERKMVVGLLMLPHDRCEQAEPHAHVTVAADGGPDELLGPRLQQRIWCRGGTGARCLDCDLGIQHQPRQRLRQTCHPLEVLARDLVKQRAGLVTTASCAQYPRHTRAMRRDAG